MKRMLTKITSNISDKQVHQEMTSTIKDGPIIKPINEEKLNPKKMFTTLNMVNLY